MRKYDFVPVPNCDGVLINCLGLVMKDGIITESIELTYPKIRCIHKGIDKPYQIHLMVASVYITNPDNKPCVNHINGIKFDTYYKNLEWVTYQENSVHRVSAGLSKSKWPVSPYLAPLGLDESTVIPHINFGNILSYSNQNSKGFKYKIMSNDGVSTTVKRIK